MYSFILFRADCEDFQSKQSFLFTNFTNLNNSMEMYMRDLQHVCDNSKSPHICREGNKVKVDHLWCQELRCPERNSELLSWFVPTLEKSRWLSGPKICY